MYRAYGAQQPELRVVETAARSGRRSEDDLHLIDRRGGRADAERLRGQMGQGLPVSRSKLAAQLGSGDTVLRLPAGDPQGDLYDG